MGTVFPAVVNNNLGVHLFHDLFDNLVEEGQDAVYRDISRLYELTRFNLRLGFVVVFQNGVGVVHYS